MFFIFVFVPLKVLLYLELTEKELWRFGWDST